jgi:hypothetical protein
MLRSADEFSPRRLFKAIVKSQTRRVKRVMAESRRVGHIAPPKSTIGKPCFFIICWCAEQTLQKARVDDKSLCGHQCRVCLRQKLVPAALRLSNQLQESNAFAVAVGQSISYSKVKLYTEIGGRVQSKALVRGDCQESNALWPESRRVGHNAPPKSMNRKPCFFIICWCVERTLQKVKVED